MSMIFANRNKEQKNQRTNSDELHQLLPNLNKKRIQREIMNDHNIEKRNKGILQKQFSQEFNQKMVKLRNEAQKILTYKERINKIYKQDEQKKRKKLQQLQKKTQQITKNKQEFLHQIIEKNKMFDVKRKQIHNKVKSKQQKRIVQSTKLIRKIQNVLEDTTIRKHMLLANRTKQIRQNRIQIIKEDPQVQVDKQKLFSKSIFKVDQRFKTNESRMSSAHSEKTLQLAKKIYKSNFEEKLIKAIKKSQHIESARKIKQERFQKTLSENKMKKAFRKEIMKKNLNQIQKVIDKRNEKIISQSNLNRKKIQTQVPHKNDFVLQNQDYEYHNKQISAKTISPSYHREIKNKLHGLTLYFYNNLKKKELQIK